MSDAGSQTGATGATLGLLQAQVAEIRKKARSDERLRAIGIHVMTPWKGGDVLRVDQLGPGRVDPDRAIGGRRRGRRRQAARQHGNERQERELFHGQNNPAPAARFRHRQLAFTWNAITAAATAAFRLSARPAIGILTSRSHSAS